MAQESGEDVNFTYNEETFAEDFALVDTNANGTISFNELWEFVRPVSKDEVKAAFKAYDTNADKKLSEEEAAILAEEEGDEVGFDYDAETFAAAFSEIDTNENGFVTLREVWRYLNPNPNYVSKKDDVEAAYKEFNADGDKGLNLEEASLLAEKEGADVNYTYDAETFEEIFTAMDKYANELVSFKELWGYLKAEGLV